MPAASLPWTRTPGGIRLTVRLTPRAAHEGLGGIRLDADGTPHLLARVAAPAVDGAANAALIRLVAQTLGVAKSAVTLTSGQTSRVKTLEVAGDPAALAGRLAKLSS